MKLDRKETFTALKRYLDTVQPEFEDDEGCYEHRAEIQHVMDSVRDPKDDDQQVERVASDLCLKKFLVWDDMATPLCTPEAFNGILDSIVSNAQRDRRQAGGK